LTLLNPLDQTGFQSALSELMTLNSDQRYTDGQLRLGLTLLIAFGALRVSHINDQPVESWGIPLGTNRRPDGDTLDQYLNTLIVRDEAEEDAEGADVLPGQVRPGGLIDRAQLRSLACWAQAGLLSDEVWFFDGHTIEYSGKAKIGKTKHGTKGKSVKAIKRFTLYNGITALSEYLPASVTFAEAMCQMVSKANATLPSACRIHKLAFDKEGWDTDLLRWLEVEQQIIPITWVKDTSVNRRLLAGVPQDEFVLVQGEFQVGKLEQNHRVLRVADTQVTFADLGQRRVVVLETEAGTRIGIYSAALHPRETTLHDQRTMTTIGLMKAMRLKQRVENGFKVDVHEMGSDAIPSHKVYERTLVQPYDLAQAKHKLVNVEKRLIKYDEQDQQYQRLLENGQIDKHEHNVLLARTQRLRRQAEREKEKLTIECDEVMVDEQGQTVRLGTTHALDLRKLTLLNLFKTHALVALHILARQLGLDGAGPTRLRREFLSFGESVEFDHQQRTVTVYAQRFPRARTQQAYERLCALLADLPVTLERGGVSYRVRFSW
jgi:hypothetical protein